MTQDEQQVATPEVSFDGLSSVVEHIVAKFLDAKHMSKLHKILSTQWDSYQSLNAAMKLMEQYGVVISPEEEQKLLKMDEAAVIDTLVGRMPQQTKEQFEHFFLQLQLIVSTATRMRMALDEGSPKVIEETLNDADKTGISPYILKMAIVQAGSEVTSLSSQHDTWCKDTEKKLCQMLRGQDDTMHLYKELAAAQQQLMQYSG